MTVRAEIILDSINPKGERITTFELEYHRYIHAEFMTHRDFSRNAASSRAIPIMKAIKLVWRNMAIPTHWGKKQAGMQADVELGSIRSFWAKAVWVATGYFVSVMTLLLKSIGVHKQVANRMLEPWTHIKVVMTTTKMENWNNLRMHKDAQPEIRLLAEKMWKEMLNSTPVTLSWGQWHLPYVTTADKYLLSRSDQLKVSVTACAQVSYRVLDTSVEKSRRIFELLIKADVIHASPFEHVARATKSGGSGNFTGTDWKQYRFYVEKSIEPPLD
jgi:hypothetical protein